MAVWGGLSSSTLKCGKHKLQNHLPHSNYVIWLAVSHKCGGIVIDLFLMDTVTLFDFAVSSKMFFGIAVNVFEEKYKSVKVPFFLKATNAPFI